MAVYRMSVSIISRSAGRSATAAAAYRSGELIHDHRTGLSHDYTRRRGVEEAWLQSPDDAPSWSREELWNRVESSETRKNSQLAREFQLSLPHELDATQRRALVRDWVDREVVARGMVADVALHAPSRHGDQRNHHAHIMVTMRPLDPDSKHGFSKRKERAWNDRGLLQHWRESWGLAQNEALRQARVEVRVDHRSLKVQREAALARGDLSAAVELHRVPQPKLGPTAAAMERRGVMTDRGELLRSAQKLSRQRVETARLWTDALQAGRLGLRDLARVTRGVRELSNVAVPGLALVRTADIGLKLAKQIKKLALAEGKGRGMGGPSL